MTKTYAQLTREIQALQASAEKLRAAEVKSVIAKLNESIAAYGLTADDLRFPGAATGGRAAASVATSTSRPNAPTDAKYSDGQGHVWGGRGPRPAWLRNAIASGRTLESFETSGSADGTDARSTRNGVAKAKASKVKLPPLYGHPKTGQTWSGRGPKPDWLKQGLKKRGTSIDDFLISARTSPTPEAAAPAVAPAPPQSPRARAKPAATAAATAATPSTPARKSLGEKVASRSKSSSEPAPVAAAKPASKAPAKKAIVNGIDGKATGKAAASPAASKTKAAPAKKSASKPAAKQAAKPSPKAAGTPRKNLPTSMAPSADAAPTPSTVPAAAPMPAPQSDSVEGRGDAAGA